MALLAHNKVKVIDEFEVSPPPGSLPSTLSLPLTFFDLSWLLIRDTHNMQRLFFYAYPHSLHDFTQTVIPSLKSSLSITLQYFYPFVSKLILPPSPPQKPYVLFTQGNSVSFTVAQYSGDDDDFDRVISHQAKDVRVLHPFAPRMLATHLLPDGTRVNSLLAVQVTLFPNQGICIGIAFNHVAADGMAFHHFMKSWASICKSKGTIDNQNFLIPSLDRTPIEDPYKLESRILQQWRDLYSRNEDLETETNNIYKDKVRSTFVLKSTHIERLKKYLSNNNADRVHFSSFVVTCSFLWTCLIKSLASSDIDDDGLCCFCFAADCRDRFGVSAPKTYFGNCIAATFPKVTKSELIGHDGLIFAAKSIGNCIKELESYGALREMEKWVTLTDEESFGTSHFATVAGSPKLGVYKTDFGWGCPIKTEVIHIDLSNAISLTDCRDDEGGIEIELALTTRGMDAFTQHFEQGLKLLYEFW